MKQVILRVDGNTKIGLGHIYRAIALAEMLKEKFDCNFLISSESEFNNVIPPYFKINLIPAQIVFEKEPSWIKKTYNNEAIVILDGYYFNSSYQKKTKDEGFKLVYIDDLQNEVMYADAVINHSPNVSAEKYKKMDYTKLFLGTNYVLLRKGFLTNAKSSKQNFVIPKKVIISMGGGDENNLTNLFFKALEQIEEIEQIDVITGAAYKHVKQISKDIERSVKKVNLYSNLSEDEVIKIMENADAAFVTCSTICFELMALNKIIYAGYSANNQRHLYDFLKECAIIGMNDLNEISDIDIIKLINENMYDEIRINRMLHFQKKLIDGDSDKRIAQIIDQI